MFLLNCFYASYVKSEVGDDGEITDAESSQVTFRSNICLDISESVSDWVNAFIERVTKQIEEHIQRGSSWRVKAIEGLSVAITCGRNDSGGASEKVPVPACLKEVRFSPNIYNVKDKSFIESVLYCLAHQDGLITKNRKSCSQKFNIENYAERFNLRYEEFPLSSNTLVCSRRRTHISPFACTTTMALEL